MPQHHNCELFSSSFMATIKKCLKVGRIAQCFESLNCHSVTKGKGSEAGKAAKKSSQHKTLHKRIFLAAEPN